MKSTVLLLGIILGLILSILGDEDNSTSPVAIGRALFSTKKIVECSKYQAGPMGCSDDCLSMRFCMNGKVIPINCLKQTGKKYCDLNTNSCSDKIDTCYNTQDYCPKDSGIFPDLLNCYRYVFCDPGNIYPMECPEGTGFNYKTQSCGEDVECATYSFNTRCKNKYGQLVKHPNPKWFVFCNYDKPTLGECPENYTFNEETASCEFQCEHLDWPQVGNYPNEMDHTMFYICYKSGNKWITKEAKCPPNSYFDYYSRICRMEYYPPTVVIPS